MSRRTADANRAIKQAWEREQRLVKEGKGTRDWTKEQQADILNPDKGKAYYKEGRAFEGQHMKSVAKYPEYQGNPDNIQFLTKEEHLAAHKGNWQNPTNWYYDPVNRNFIEFTEEGIIPCKVDMLSNPIAIVHKSQNESKVLNSKEGFDRRVKSVGRFIAEHPFESLEIGGVILGSVVAAVSSFRSSRRKNNLDYSPHSSNRSRISTKTDIASKVADIVEKANRATPRENDVPGHRQRYHTKSGVIWKEKPPYHRGKKDNEKRK